MTREQIVLNAMIEDFQHWANYNPTLLREKYNIQDMTELRMLFERIKIKFNR